MRVIDFFDKSAAVHRDQACLIDDNRSLTYQQVSQLTYTVAAAMKSKGTAPGARIAVLGPNAVDTMIVILSLFRAGAIWVPANSRSTGQELGALLELVECDALLVHRSLSELATVAAKKAGCRIVSFEELDIERQSNSATRVADLAFPWDHTDPCTLFPTGGTTGVPKAAIWTHRTWEALTANFHAGICHEERPIYLVAAPLTHAAGVVSIPLLAVGATVVLIPRADPEAVMTAIQHHRVTTLFLPPTVIYELLAHPNVRTCDFSSLRTLIYAAAPMSVAKLRLAMEVFGPVMLQTYGQAEAPMVCTILTRQDHVDALKESAGKRLESCGRPSLLTELAILDERGESLSAGEVGEIAVRGDLVMAGYWRGGPAPIPDDMPAWHLTGDIGYCDRDGYVYITDRKRDMIISGGFNVFPSEVEQVLWAHESVKDCAVIGVPDEKWGEAVCAVVELKSGMSVTEAELIALCKATLGSVKAPKKVLFWSTLPRSGVGKVLKREIRARFWLGTDRILSM